MQQHTRFSPVFFQFAAAIVAGSCWLTAGLVAADTPEKSWQWRAIVGVEQQVTHSVLLQDSISGDLRRRTLIGPEGLVMPATGDACLCRYQIDPVAEEQPAGRLQLQLAGASEPVVVVVGPPRAALLPAQLLRDGPPVGEAGRTVYEHRPVLAVERGQAGDFAAVCLPVEYRHHFERLQPGEDATGFVVRQAAVAATEDSFGIVDDLGTNKITLGASRQGLYLLEQIKVIRSSASE